MRFNNYSRLILKADFMILPSCAKVILIFLLAILHKVLTATVIVIDKTDCIMKDNSMLILFQLLDCIYQSILCEGSHCFHLKSVKHDSALHLTCIMSGICVSGKNVILEASWQVG